MQNFFKLSHKKNITEKYTTNEVNVMR